ncbi:hypothetical protein CF15_00830 [Pyrodictium occultum]|uniref:Creatininase n=1 Tax=Pyrodictium occultum TaxID=2309 RepID=A0A0V8RU19_PYROC|nr:creatininase family protein [Pyrodictium occultum]KSW11434.1 hypothetical protein CF15_00830 [Pyrodictium occultum]
MAALLELLGPGERVELVVQPIASIENHGVLPLGSDLLIARCVAERLRLPRGAAVAPPIPYSTAMEHEGFRVSLSPETFIRYLVEAGSSILQGARSLVFAVFHGGAFHAAYLAARVLRGRGHDAYLFNFWDTVSRALGREALIHADCVEASILLACGHSKGVKPVEELGEECLRSSPGFQPWVARDVPGIYPAEPVPASRRLGERLLGEAVTRLEELVESILGRRRASSPG